MRRIVLKCSHISNREAVRRVPFKLKWAWLVRTVSWPKADRGVVDRVGKDDSFGDDDGGQRLVRFAVARLTRPT